MSTRINHTLICLFCICSTLSASHEDQDRQNHMATLNALSRFPLPQRERPVRTEQQILSQVFETADPNNQELQQMIAKFKNNFGTITKFKAELDKTVMSQGPMTGHGLILEFAYILRDYHSLDPYGSGSLFDYYEALCKAALLKQNRPGPDDDNESLRALSNELTQVRCATDCLFDQGCNRILEELETYAQSNIDSWQKERKLHKDHILVSGDDIIIDTDNIAQIQDKLPKTAKSVECRDWLNDKNINLLLKYLVTYRNLIKIDLLLEDPSSQTLMTLTKFLNDNRTGFKKCEIQLKDKIRMDPACYDAIRKLENVISIINPRMMD